MRIAILTPIKRPITPQTTVSRNRVIFDLVSELINIGHEVTIFGTKDSVIPGAKVIGIAEKGLNFLPPTENPFYRHAAYLSIMIAQVIKRQNEFNIIHNHMYPEFLPLLASSAIRIPIVTTVHAQMTKELVMTLRYFPQAHLVAISEVAKKASGLPMEVIYNGIDTDFFIPTKNPKKDYLLFVGRLSRAKDGRGNFLDPKGVLHAINVAEKLKEKLLIVGNVEERRFYDELIKPRLTDNIRFIGEPQEEPMLSREQMRELFQNAKALLFPINWEEPFGLVMVEAMSCGTPVIGFNRGSVSEIIIDGKTGFVVDPSRGIKGLIEALEKLNTLSIVEYETMSKTSQKYVKEQFSIKQMVENYEKLYQHLQL